MLVKHVAVLMGGQSAEREVSLASGKACASALRSAGYKVSEIEINEGQLTQLINKITPKPDAVLILFMVGMERMDAFKGYLNYCSFPTHILVFSHQHWPWISLQHWQCSKPMEFKFQKAELFPFKKCIRSSKHPMSSNLCRKARASE